MYSQRFAAHCHGAAGLAALRDAGAVPRLESASSTPTLSRTTAPSPTSRTATPNRATASALVGVCLVVLFPINYRHSPSRNSCGYCSFFVCSNFPECVACFLLWPSYPNASGCTASQYIWLLPSGAGNCKCAATVNNNGTGGAHCESLDSEGPWCYVDAGICSDEREPLGGSGIMHDYHRSTLACTGSLVCGEMHAVKHCLVLVSTQVGKFSSNAKGVVGGLMPNTHMHTHTHTQVMDFV